VVFTHLLKRKRKAFVKPDRKIISYKYSKRNSDSANLSVALTHVYPENPY